LLFVISELNDTGLKYTSENAEEFVRGKVLKIEKQRKIWSINIEIQRKSINIKILKEKR
jgi:hypothetical protein